MSGGKQRKEDGEGGSFGLLLREIKRTGTGSRQKRGGVHRWM